MKEEKNVGRGEGGTGERKDVLAAKVSVTRTRGTHVGRCGFQAVVAARAEIRHALVAKRPYTFACALLDQRGVFRRG